MTSLTGRFSLRAQTWASVSSGRKPQEAHPPMWYLRKRARWAPGRDFQQFVHGSVAGDRRRLLA